MKPIFSLATTPPTAATPDYTALLRWSLVVVFLWFGGMKFTLYEAQGIAPFIEHSPFMSWLLSAFGVRGASAVIGALELATAVALATGAFHRGVSVLGAAMSCATYAITLTFFFTTPGVAEPTAGGLPAISAPIGQFLLKDLVLLAASALLLRTSLAHWQAARDASPRLLPGSAHQPVSA
ncbi:YkgB family protein [Cupriavidus necator]|uniref:YkgB family protein n=1 Tax=Cupriavidus necator TaxID=106590 RepID=UPI00068FE370|nr:DUF417 family protein [Cupriavidus necator]